jgi:hypothetical protein
VTGAIPPSAPTLHCSSALPSGALVLLLLVLIGAGCATRWEGEGSVHRREDRIDVIALSLAQFGPDGYCRYVNDFNALLRTQLTGAFQMSCESVVVDTRARPANFYVAARSTGEYHFSFVGSATADGTDVSGSGRSLSSRRAWPRRGATDGVNPRS